MTEREGPGYAAKAARLVLSLAAIPVLGYLLLLGASDARVSGGLAVGPHNLIEHNMVWDQLQKAYQQWSWLPRPAVTRVERVDAGDAVRNLVFVFCVTGLSMLVVPIMFFAGVWKLLYGLATASWAEVGIGAVAMVLAPLLLIGFLLAGILMWGSLLLQPCTPAYALIFLVAGLPVLGLGGASGAAPCYSILVIIRQ